MVKIAEGGVKQFNILFTNDIDRGPFVADTLRADTTTGREEALVEIYKVMRPGEPPTKKKLLKTYSITYSSLLSVMTFLQWVV